MKTIKDLEALIAEYTDRAQLDYPLYVEKEPGMTCYCICYDADELGRCYFATGSVEYLLAYMDGRMDGEFGS